MPIQSQKYEFTKTNVDNAPIKAGVYALFVGAELIYYGRAQGGTVTIKSRLQSHFAGTEGACTKAAKYYAREECSNPVAREVELLNEYKARFKKLPRCNERVG